MTNLLRAVFAVALLAIPLLVITGLPRLFELASSVPVPGSQATAPAPAFRLLDPTPGGARPRFVRPDETPPPTLSPPVATATPPARQRAAPTGERIVIGNTGGQGAVLRDEPVTGHPLGALREQQVLDVLERRNVPGSGDWVHVRTGEGLEGWVTGLVALPVTTANN